MRKNILTYVLLTTLFMVMLAACSEREVIPLPIADDYDAVSGATPSGKLRVGLVPGLYGDMFTELIQPSLEEMGYTLEVVHYDNDSLPNIALAENQIDLNIYQHYKSLNHFKFENDVALSAIAEVPTTPMGIFSLAYDSFQDITKGAAVSIPIESTEYARALIVLENAGLITLNPLISKEKATEEDVISNPYGLTLTPMPAENLVKSLSVCGLSVIDGGYAASGNLDLSNVLFHEVMVEDYFVVIAVRTGDLHAQFISDIITIVNSDAF